MKRISAMRQAKTAWKRDNLRVLLSSAPSIEECGLDSALYGEGLPFLTPRGSSPPQAAAVLGRSPSTNSIDSSEGFERTLPMPGLAVQQQSSSSSSSSSSRVDEEAEEALSFGNGKKEGILNSATAAAAAAQGEENGRHGKKISSKVAQLGSNSMMTESSTSSSNNAENDILLIAGGTEWKDAEVLNSSNNNNRSSSFKDRSLRLRKNPALRVDEMDGRQQYRPALSEGHEKNIAETSQSGKSMAEVYSKLKSKGSISEIQEEEEVEEEEEEEERVLTKTPQKKPGITSHSKEHAAGGKSEVVKEVGKGGNNNSNNSKPPLGPPRFPRLDSDPTDLPGGRGSAEARRRWRRVSNTLTFARHMSSVRASASDFLEHNGPDILAHGDYHVRSDAGRAGAAAFEGARTRALGGRARAKGRKGMEGMLVRQDKGLVTLVQDFYVACLKMPIAHFLVGVFLAPIALGLLFTPFYLFDKAGLAVDGVTLSDDVGIVGRVAAAKQKVSALVNVFLYALSLSTTFGGSPVNAMSPFCLIIANINTLMGQFLFVFLSGAVFARMSQPSHPVRCSRKAIIRVDDFNSMPLDELKEKFRVFAVRLVLTGPPPCELVDAKICLTFRIFIKLPSGSMFCSTQDLELVRPEVPYLRYGIMVRHIIHRRSPLYGHSMESLSDGDASFSLTISGLERTSMQAIFHLEDYFVCDGDVAWDGDYVDFIHINTEGQRVLDHSKIDEIHTSKETKFGSGGTPSTKSLEKESQRSPGPVKGWSASALRGRKIWSSKSTSFTRADW